MSLDVDVFWSFRSPYSYLATPRLVRLAVEYDVAVNVRVVLPIAVRIPGFFETVNPLWPPYLLRDTMRIAEYERMPYRWPRPDPIVQDFPSRKVAAERAGLDLAELDAAIAADPGRHDEIIAENQRALEAAGHWGVPTMVFAGEPFFGQDRIELLIWRMQQHGLRRRPA